MLPYRRVVLGFCIVAPLCYVYWAKLATQAQTSGGWRFGTASSLNDTLGFSKIFVINLPTRTDRRDAMALAGAVSNLSFTWIDGVTGDDVPVPADGSPRPGKRRKPDGGARGSRRSHGSALRAMVEQRLPSALVLEDDVDWDVRLRGQLAAFAAGTRTWLAQQQQQPSPAPRRSLAADFAPPLGGDEFRGPATASPGVVYGDGWDVLWLGHCGADLPPSPEPPVVALARRDASVPAPRHLKAHPFARADALARAYPPHTRVVHAARGNACSLAYAVSQRGARKLLLGVGDGEQDEEKEGKGARQWDITLRDWCQGGGGGEEEEEKDMGMGKPVCITVQPPLVSHYYGGKGKGKGAASSSDIQGLGGGYARGYHGSPYIRLSVRGNLGRLVAGGVEEKDLVDQLPDDGEPIW
ncbi:glycosyltransferase family 25 protein [Xylariomycetidae sp. FL0641]|nr:glycosyltransferase family 25 protein [Xylariomycetidae sp. FL0641]